MPCTALSVCPMPLTTKTQEITISGSCGTVFNPSTGFCKEKATITRNFSLEAKEHQERSIYYTLYTLLTDKDVTDIHITATAKDKEEKVIKTISFDNVHLVIGKKTTYTGPLYTYPNNMSFTVNQPEIPASGYDKKF